MLLQSLRMAQHAALCRAAHGAPARAFALAIIAGVDSQTSHHHKDMPASRIDCHPIAGTRFAEVAEAVGRNRRGKQARAMQNIGCGAGAIVAFANKGTMSSPINIRPTDDLVACGDGPFHWFRRVRRSNGLAISNNSRSPVNELILVRRRRGSAAREKKCEEQNKS